MTSRKEKFNRSKFANVRWFAGLSLFLFAYWWVMTNFVIRDFYDPQYVMKFERLEARVKENPQRPLWLVMGSSRVERGLRPALLNENPGDKDAPMIYNFGLGGASMFRQYICLRRLLDAGIKPKVVGIEILGATMSREMFDETAAEHLLIRARRDELGDYMHYADDAPKFLHYWRLSRWDPAYRYGMKIPGQTLAWRLIPLPGARLLERVPYDQWGWFPEPPAPIPAAAYNKAFDIAKEQLENKFDDFKVSDKFDAPLRRMLEMCRNAGIKVFLLKMPESPDFRALYPPQAGPVIDAYLQTIEREYNVPLIDARLWIAKEGFTDGHHLNATGAEEFTRRFGGELSALKF